MRFFDLRAKPFIKSSGFVKLKEDEKFQMCHQRSWRKSQPLIATRQIGTEIGKTKTYLLPKKKEELW